MDPENTDASRMPASIAGVRLNAVRNIHQVNWEHAILVPIVGILNRDQHMVELFLYMAERYCLTALPRLDEGSEIP